MAKSIYSLFDRLVIRELSEESLKTEIFEARVYKSDPSIQEMNTEFSALDTKASSLISHISIMIASVSILFSFVHDISMKRVFMLEIALYATNLIVVLRVVSYSYYSEIFSAVDKDERADLRSISLMAELKRRMIYYRLGHMLASSGTLLFLASLFVAFVSLSYL